MPPFCFGGVIRPKKRCRSRILTVVVIFGSYDRFLAATTTGAELKT
jgi:hypothetical protein